MKFKNGIAIPTTKFEKVMLQKLKYDLLDNDYVCGNWHPEECAIYHPLDLVDALGIQMQHIIVEVDLLMNMVTI